MSYSELRKQILSLLSRPPYRYNVPYLALLFKVDRTTIHHVIRPLVRKGIIHKEVYDGLTWISLRSKTLYESLRRNVDYHIRKKPSRELTIIGSHSQNNVIIDVDFGKKQSIVDLIKNKRVSQTVFFPRKISTGLGKEVLGSNHGFLTMKASSGSMVRKNGNELGERAPRNFQQKSKEAATGPIPNFKIKWPRRAHWARIQAFRILVRRKQLTLDDWIVLNRLFNAYLEDTGHRVILLMDEYEESVLWLKYKHRFTREGIRRLINRFNNVFKKANSYQYGIFLTLTLDPKKYPNMIVARYELQKAWNRMMSYFKKKLGKKPAFIRIIEFTKKHGTGLIHYHVLILGVKRLMAKDRYEARLPKPVLINNKYKSTIWASTLDELYDRIKKYGFQPEEVKIIDHGESLKQLLEKWGFGKIHDIKYVINFNGRWMTYNFYKALSSTNDGAGISGIRNLKGYLKKYLVKAFNDLDLDTMEIKVDEPVPLTLYWALNTRFFTYSKQLRPESEPVTTTRIIINGREIGYRFLGTGYIVNPEVLPLQTDKPPWTYFIDNTFPPWYDPTLEL